MHAHEGLRAPEAALPALARMAERGAWGAQVLRWMGYFTESVPQSPDEDFRVRRVEVRLEPFIGL